MHRAQQLIWKAEGFERTEMGNRKIVGTIRNVGHGGCYALYFDAVVLKAI